MKKASRVPSQGAESRCQGGVSRFTMEALKRQCGVGVEIHDGSVEKTVWKCGVSRCGKDSVEVWGVEIHDSKSGNKAFVELSIEQGLEH